MGGDWHKASCPTLSKQERAHPTDPSPPHTKILNFGMFLNTYKLWKVILFVERHLMLELKNYNAERYRAADFKLCF